MSNYEKEGIRFVERSLLGTLILKPSLYVKNEKKLTEDLFSSDKNKNLFSIIKEQYAKADEIDFNLLSNEVNKKLRIDYQKLNDNYLSLCEPKRFDDYLKEIVEYSKKSSLLKAIEETRVGIKEDEDSDVLIAKLLKALEKSEGEEPQTYHASEFIISTMDSVYMAKNSKGLSGVNTGLNSLNERNGGWQRGDVTIIAARAGLGKTTMSMNFALTAAREGRPVAIFSLEMSSEQLLLLLAEILTGISTEDIRAGKVNDAQIKEIEDSMLEIKKLPLFLIGGPRTIEDILMKIRFLNKRIDLTMVIVDYLQLIPGNSKEGNRNSQIENISRQLKLIAMPNECNVSMIVLSQLNRGVESRADKRPMSSDLRDSGAIEQDADMILMLYRDNYYDHNCTDDTTELIVTKNRMGKTGIIKLSYRNRKYVNWEGDINEAYDPEREFYDIPF